MQLWPFVRTYSPFGSEDFIIIGYRNLDKAGTKVARKLYSPRLQLERDHNVSTLTMYGFFQKSANKTNIRIIKTWQNHWDSIPASNKLRSIKKTVSKWAYPENASRREQIIINRSRIGHSHITHSYLITKESPPLCDTCKTHISMAHIIIDCPKYSTARFLLNNPRSPEEALSQQNSGNIFKFFKKIDLDKKPLIICVIEAFMSIKKKKKKTNITK
ncbi:hypothetical protein AGLY_018071, partial [Aphis glycines]